MVKLQRDNVRVECGEQTAERLIREAGFKRIEASKTDDKPKAAAPSRTTKK